MHSATKLARQPVTESALGTPWKRDVAAFILIVTLSALEGARTAARPGSQDLLIGIGAAWKRDGVSPP
jgi:hypothetical protein